jgi:hypothetical protein
VQEAVEEAAGVAKVVVQELEDLVVEVLDLLVE